MLSGENASAEMLRGADGSDAVIVMLGVGLDAKLQGIL